MSCCGGNDKKRRIREIGDPDSSENMRQSGKMRIIPAALIIGLALILYYFIR